MAFRVVVSLPKKVAQGNAGAVFAHPHDGGPDAERERQERVGGGERHLNTANTHQANQPLLRNLLYFRQSMKDEPELRADIYFISLTKFHSRFSLFQICVKCYNHFVLGL